MNKLLEKDNNKEAIVAYLRNPEAEDTQLSNKQRELLRYYHDAYNQLRTYNSVPDAINVLVKMSQLNGKIISRSTARRYVYDAMDVFGYSSKIRKEGIQHLSTEIILDAVAMAKAQQDPKTMIAGAKELAQINGADEVEGFNAEMLEPHIIQILLDPEAIKVIKLLAGKGTIDLDVLMGNAMNSLAEDVTYADTNDREAD